MNYWISSSWRCIDNPIVGKYIALGTGRIAFLSYFAASANGFYIFRQYTYSVFWKKQNCIQKTERHSNRTMRNLSALILLPFLSHSTWIRYQKNYLLISDGIEQIFIRSIQFDRSNRTGTRQKYIFHHIVLSNEG